MIDEDYRALGIAAALALIAGSLVLLWSCGPAPVAGTKLPEGEYAAGASVQFTKGSCSWVPMTWHGAVTVDANGQLSSPFPGTSGCRTTYTDGVEVECRGLGNTLLLRGALFEERRAWLAGDITGNVSGCTRIVVVVELGSARDGGT
jgi:hypothetical protein